MTSPKTLAALRIARSLRPAEAAINNAAVKVLAMGSALLTARADGTVHPLDSQEAVNYVVDATAQVFGALRAMKLAHHELYGAAVKHQVLGQGIFDESPDHEQPHGSTSHASLSAIA